MMLSLCFVGKVKLAGILLQDASAMGGGGCSVHGGLGPFLWEWEMVHSSWIQYLFMLDYWDTTQFLGTNISRFMLNL